MKGATFAGVGADRVSLPNVGRLKRVTFDTADVSGVRVKTCLRGIAKAPFCYTSVKALAVSMGSPLPLRCSFMGSRCIGG